jgi:hypothetical protein
MFKYVYNCYFYITYLCSKMLHKTKSSLCKPWKRMGGEVQILSFLSSTLERSVPRPNSFSKGERAPLRCAKEAGQADLEVLEQRITPCLFQESKIDSSVTQLVAYSLCQTLYSDSWTII